jgi:tRNA-modifying protein YgfZ
MTDITSQYRTTVEGAGWTGKFERGRLRFEGRDRISFLQALVSNDMAALGPGQGIYAVYLTPQGRMLADMRLYERGEFLVADVPAKEAPALAQRFDSLVFAEDVRVTDVSASLGQLAVIGNQAADVIARAFSLDAETVRALPLLSHMRARDAVVARTDDAECPSYDVFVDSSVDANAGLSVTRQLESAGAAPVFEDVLEALRIEAGRPSFGRDMTGETIPLEAGLLDRAISTTKGCYVGQEVIVRVLHRGGGRVVKRLVKLVAESSIDSEPAVGAELFDANPADPGAPPEGRRVGTLTSVAFSPARERIVALGYVHRDSAEPGRHVAIGAPSGPRAEIIGFAG